ALYGKGLEIAGRIADASGAKLLAPYPITRLERGRGTPGVERINYVLEQAVEQLAEFRQLILVGAKAPVAYFGYPDKSSLLTRPETAIHTLASETQDIVGTLEALAATLGSSSRASTDPHAGERPAVPAGEISLPGLSAAIGALLPDNMIVVDES